MAAAKKIALITGAGSGIGRQITLSLLQADYIVVLAGRRLDALQDTIQLAGALGENALAVTADISNPESVKTLFATIKEKFGRLDLLFNNAGVFAPQVSLEDLSFEQWQASVDINLTGAFLCTQEAFKLMRDQSPQGGRIINNGSISAHAPRPFAVSYTATKHAITGLTKAASLDGRRYNIAVGQIDIGNAASAMTATMSKGSMQADGSLKPEPTMSADHVANAILYMDSLPLDANVQFMTVMATNMPYIGRG
jgi:NAD(P)-dependent dehydrogenase (short-subunit alcohol dehydrogenase family)